jgi:hypothetical protein
MSLIFDNVNDFAHGTPPITSSYYGASGVTICAWFKATAVGNTDGIVTLGNQTNTFDSFAARMNTSGALEATASHATGTGTVVATSNTVTAGAWQHGAFIFTNSTSRTAVLNGVWASRGTSTADRTPTTAFTTLVVGADTQISANSPNNDWDGKIAHVAIWSIALTQSEVESLAAGANPATVQPANLIWYVPATVSGDPGNETIGGLDLTLVNQAAYDSDNPTLTSTVAPIAAYYRMLANA